ncbi:MAG: hypothetical protein AUG07_02750 [Acidobacteria bacterium 13_1_20CM_2_60_10]|nr:MAG: hypothetical protein AUG07_02750 [Acidobacteria bacterium 13_1_20CM_2_60_10]
MSPEAAEVIFSTMILAISITALAQFALYYWRAVLAGVAAQPVSERTLAAAGLNSGGVTADAFATLASLHELTPELKSGGGLGLVRMYYRFVGALRLLAGSRFPALSAWSEREGTVCARYAAVLIDRRMEASFALAASLRNH